jgi:hypothetical protein
MVFLLQKKEGVVLKLNKLPQSDALKGYFT